MDVDKILSGEVSMRDAIDTELITRLTRKLGYSFDDSRISRLRVETQKYMGMGASFPTAYAEAFEVDLLLHGDPLAKDTIQPMRVSR